MKLLKRGLILPIILGIFLLSLAAFAIFCFVRSEYNNVKKGTPVECTITSVVKFGNSSFIDGFYENENGDIIRAEIINTGPDVSVGKTMKGYVFPDSPNKVHIPSSILIIFLLIMFLGVCVTGGCYSIVYAVKTRINYNFLLREGIPTVGTIVEIKIDKSGDYTYYIANIRYIDDSDGSEHFFEDYHNKNCRMVGDEIYLQYAKKKNGKYVVELVE